MRELVVFIILSLSVWRLCSLFVDEPGPFHLFEKFRKLIGAECGADCKKGFLAELFSCIWCLSVWVAAIVGVTYMYYPQEVEFVGFLLAMSAVSCIINHFTSVE